MDLAAALERLREIDSLPAGYRDPKLADDPPHLSEPWVPLPKECLDTVRALLFRLDAERLPLPVEIWFIAPYMGNGGVGLSWRDAQRSVTDPPAVSLSVTVVAGMTCTVFENDVFERESHARGYGAASSDEIYPFLAEALTWWAKNDMARPG